jgi:glutamyl-tRNA synthetase
VTGPGSPVRLRIAPSPTGDPHVGTAYMALFNLAFVRQQGGSFVLRIEDTDQGRFVAASEQLIFDTLHWLGLGWDEGPDVGGPYAPYRQSERLANYRPPVDRLLADGRAYHCWCSRERLAQMRDEQQRAKRPTGYDRRCLGMSRDERSRLPGFTEQPVVRMLVPPDPPLSFVDLVHGQVHAPHPDDQVLIKADGFPTYHLAVVVDDHDMDISHVVRGEEWISSTPKHLLLYDWLGWERPQFAHMPLLRNQDRSKISKRKNPAARLRWFQEQGFLPEALRNFLALMGYSLPDGREVFDFDELSASFDWSRLNPVGPVFDLDKLDWLNGYYIRGLADEEFLRRAAPFLPTGVTAESLTPLAGSLKERTRRLAEIPDQTEWLAEDPEVPADLLLAQGLAALDAATALEEAADALAAVAPFTAPAVEPVMTALPERYRLPRRKLLMTIRVALTGRPVSPPLHETIAALGPQRTASRLRAAAAALRDR